MKFIHNFFAEIIFFFIDDLIYPLKKMKIGLNIEDLFNGIQGPGDPDREKF